MALSTDKDIKKIEFETLCGLAFEWELATKTASEILDKTKLCAMDFWHEEPREVFCAFENAIRLGDQFDRVAFTLKSKKLNRKLLDSIFEKASPGLQARIDVLKKFVKRRRMRQIFEAATTLAGDIEKHEDEAEAFVRRALDELSAGSKPIGMLENDLFGYLDRLDRVQKGELQLTLKTGIEALDAVIGGWVPNLNFIGALPSVGKSSLLAASVRSLKQRRIKCGVISLEDERHWLTRRLLAAETDVPVFVLANRPLGKHQLERVGAAAEKFYDFSGIFIDDRGFLTVEEIVASCREMIAGGAKCIFIDHLGEIKVNQTQRPDLDIQRVCVELRAIAKTHDIPVVVLAHLKQGADMDEFTRPELGHFALSAAVSRTARLALGLSKDKESDSTILCTVLKQTQGMKPPNPIALNFNKSAAIVMPTAAPEAARFIYGRDD